MGLQEAHEKLKPEHSGFIFHISFLIHPIEDFHLSGILLLIFRFLEVLFWRLLQQAWVFPQSFQVFPSWARRRNLTQIPDFYVKPVFEILSTK